MTVSLPKIVLAPLAGYTNAAFRRIANEMGVELCFSEMISVKGLIYDGDRTKELAYIDNHEKKVSLQIFGGEVSDIVGGALKLKGLNYFTLDINCGCPVKKVLKTGGGSKLLETPQKIGEMIKALRELTDKEVSIKIRGGISKNTLNAVEVAKIAEANGAAFITVHGRTQNDLYKGKCNLDYIKTVKAAVNIPVIGNGDIRSIADAEAMFEYTKCDAVMVGRAALTNPWLLKDLVDYYNGTYKEHFVSLDERIALIYKHFDYLLQIKPLKIVILEMRSVACFYLKGVAECKGYREKLIKLNSKVELENILEEMRRKI